MAAQRASGTQVVSAARPKSRLPELPGRLLQQVNGGDGSVSGTDNQANGIAPGPPPDHPDPRG